MSGLDETSDGSLAVGNLHSTPCSLLRGELAIRGQTGGATADGRYVGSVFAHVAPQHGAAQRAREMPPHQDGTTILWRRAVLAWKDRTYFVAQGLLIVTVSSNCIRNSITL